MAPGRTRGNPRLRWADRYLGPPLLAAAGLGRRRRSLPDCIRRIALLKLAAVGDTVLLAGIVADLAESCPGAELVMFAGPDNAEAARLIDGLSDVRVVPPARPDAALRALRRWRADVLLDCGNWSRLEAAYSAFSGARFTVGFNTPGQGRHRAHDAAAPHGDDVHELDNYRRLLDALGVPATHDPAVRPRRVLRPQQRPEPPYVVFHPWPSGLRRELKEWPRERWVELARWAQQRGRTVVLTGSSADREVSAGLSARCGGTVDTAGTLSLAAVVDLVAGAECVVSVNTGIMHLAAAAGAPTVGLNGPTAERRWGPIGPAATSVNSTLPRCGYLNLGWEYADQREDCMCGISVDAVEEAMARVARVPRAGRPEVCHG